MTTKHKMNTKKVLKEYVYYYIKEVINLQDFDDIDYFFVTYFLNIPCVNSDEEARTIMKYENIEDINEKLYLCNGDNNGYNGYNITKEVINKYWKVLGREAINNNIFMEYLYKNKRGIVQDCVLEHVITKIINKNKMSIENLFEKIKM
jgi:hypothetical protein